GARLLGRAGERANQLVEGPLHVEEERVEVRTARPDPGERDAARTAGERGEAERVFQAMRRIDGQHGRPPAAAGRLDRERGGGAATRSRWAGRPRARGARRARGGAPPSRARRAPPAWSPRTRGSRPGRR